MKLSDIIGNKAPEEVRVSALNWPRVFYDETDAETRQRMLEKALEQRISPEEDAERKYAFELRYGKKEKSGILPDRFMQLGLECIYNAKQKKNPSMRMRKQLAKTLETMGLTGAASGSVLRKEMLSQEIRHAVCFYIAVCRQDRNYQSVIFGLGRMKEETVTAKIREDIERIAHGLDAAEEDSPFVKMWRETAQGAAAQMLS